MGELSDPIRLDSSKAGSADRLWGQRLVAEKVSKYPPKQSSSTPLECGLEVA